MRRRTNTSKPITKTACPHCPSSDAYAIFSDNHGFCFSCRRYDPNPNELNVRREVKPISLIEIKEYKPLRGLLQKTVERWGYGIGHWKKQTVHVAPYYDRRRNLIAQHLRTRDKEFPWLGKFDKITLWGQQLCTGTSMLIITEGEIDAMSVGQAIKHQYDIVSVPNGAQGAARSIQDNIDFVDSYREVILMFDNDEPGHQATREVAEILSPGKAKIFPYGEVGDFKDANEILQAKQGARILPAIFKSIPYRPDGIMDGQDLYDDVHAPVQKGWSVPYPGLQKMLYGFRKGELYLLTAAPGIGKSTLVRELGYHMLAEHEHSIGVVELEDARKNTVKHYVGLALNKPIVLGTGDVTQEQIDEAFHKTVGSGRFYVYDHWGSVDLDRLMQKFRYLAVGCGVDWIILDHISIVVSGLDEIQSSERKLIDKLMTRLRSLIEETGIGVMAIVHLSRPTDQTNKGFNEGKQVTLRSLRGSGGLEQISDVVIAMERDQQDTENSDKGVLRILKNRPIGRTGIADTVVYKHETGRLISEEQDDFDNEETDAF